MTAFLGELEGGVNSERRHFKLNRFIPQISYLELRRPWQEYPLASLLSE